MHRESPYQQIHQETFKTPNADVRRGLLPKQQPEQQEVSKEYEEGLKVFTGKSKEEYINIVEAEQGPEAREVFEKVLKICEKVKEEGGRALLVGGCIRDEILGVTSKDFDVEIYGIQPDKLAEILGTFGKIDTVGQAFRILKITDGEMDIDVSIPRTDSKVAAGHRGFEVNVDPNMSITEAGRRRDFTFNALSKDPLTAEIFDPFNGVEDLSKRTLRITDETLFKDDPLRVMRACQFVGRFALRIDTKSLEIMQKMVGDMHELVIERVKKKKKKALLKSIRPSMALQAMHEIGVLEELYPELAALQNVPQEGEWHPEGDVWTHTLLVVDEAKKLSDNYNLKGDEKKAVIYTALCHDLGKPQTTEFTEGRIRSRGHELAGGEPARAFLERIGVQKKLVEKIVKLTENHLWPGTVYREAMNGTRITDGAFRRLAKRIHPATIRELTYVEEADFAGRGPFMDPKHARQFLLPQARLASPWVRERAKQLGIEKAKPEPLLQGRQLMQLGFKPGRQFGELTRLADDLRDINTMSGDEIVQLIVESATIEEAIVACRTAMTGKEQ